MFKFLKKEKWVLVKTFSEDVRQIDRKENYCKVYFHLFESDQGNRKVEAVTKGLTGFEDNDVIDAAKRLNLYQTRIYRWLNGRLDPEISTYNQISEEDTLNILKGTVS